MKKKILIISNPKSGMTKRNNEINEILRMFSKHDYAVTIMNTTGAGDATEFAKKEGSKYDIVVCKGGDGTFNEIMNGIMTLENKPEIGFIPAGTTNDLANTIGLSSQSDKAVQTIVTEPPRPCDLGSFNGRYFTYVASFGAFTKCSYATSQKLKNKIGRLAYFYEAAKEVKDIKGVPMRCTVDGKTFEGKFMFGSISNSLTVGKIIHLDETTVCLNDGKFEVLFAENPGTVKGWLKIAQCLLKKNLEHENIKFLEGSNIKIETLDGSAIPWTVDGEFAGDVSSVDLEVCKHAFMMYRPPMFHEKNSDKDEPIVT
ncbi:MAG: diacylglycerol kinase family lipid kinase [Ruminococcaceae bacterium]|nr:diacylglycerol kinase family lipid kinase [Oscillospiraceae bacterium]